MKHEWEFVDDKIICKKCNADLQWESVTLYSECPEIAITTR